MNIVKQYSYEACKDNKSLLLEEFGKNKIIPESIQLQALVALSHFPELKEARVRFIFGRSRLAYASRPAMKSILRSPLLREYQIILSTASAAVPDELLFNNLPFNAQIGILGHELSHTIYYLQRTSTEIISTGINYLNSKYRVKFENDTDKEAIRRGLGWQLLDFARYYREHPAASPALIAWLDTFYLSPSDILDYIQTIPAYTDPYGKDQ